jgi:hypothetical protein
MTTRWLRHSARHRTLITTTRRTLQEASKTMKVLIVDDSKVMRIIVAGANTV